MTQSRGAPRDVFIEDLILDHVEPLAKNLGLAVWGIEIGGGSNVLVRIFVEKPGAEPAPKSGQSPGEGAGEGVSIDHCAEISRRLALALEVEEVFADTWTLEVSSPGFERPFFVLEQLRPYIGRTIELVLASPLEEWPGRKKFVGLVQQVDDEEFTLGLAATERRADEAPDVRIPWCAVRKAHVVHVFEEPGKPGKGKKKPAPQTENDPVQTPAAKL